MADTIPQSTVSCGPWGREVHGTLSWPWVLARARSCSVCALGAGASGLRSTTTSRSQRGSAAAANADLSNLAVSSGTLSPVFAAGTVSYTAAVGNAVTSITVTPTVADATATVKVNGTAVTSGSASGGISLNVGANTIAVLVTAQDGSTTKTYTVTVTRADAAGQCGSAQGVTTVFPPAANLCNAGVGSTVSRVGSNWSWSCTGGASTASCTAPLQDTATHAGVGFATVVDDANHWVVDAANSAGFIPVTGHAK